jgi:S-adenosylmethionine hydrolase
VKRPVVLVSDCCDLAFAEMRGAMWTAAGGQVLHIEPVVPTHPMSVLNAAFGVRMMAEAYPPGTIITFVVNPLKERTERIVGRTKVKDLFFEGTNTGVAGWLVDDFGCEELYELHDPGFLPFGGKYVHAPAVGRLAAGADLRDLGDPFPLERLRRADRPDRTIVHVDNFGNAKFPWLDGDVHNRGARYRVSWPGHNVEAVLWIRMMELDDGEWVLFPGSSLDLWELGQVRGRGIDVRDAPPGTSLTITPL